ncbi:putative sporulation protein YtxC [Anaerobranca californiensis DSM 14826]|jgi:putative sporulation protein YtxC|uniref:Putative sporulation protein YtxC n=1 Tax=Anaerobranca californiensis DSM 14826 TaxID=1120989 RepID=A0A1M6PSN3_9FIRM|nr:putative sporulation protein YtxC [Anaerobranca californiensis]SHK10892.1 putative sporulation protein YtxC [Anaerobranca californiensis DSM 14826]
MKSLTIGTKGYLEQFKFCLEDKLEPLRQLGIEINLTEESKGNITFLGCSIHNTTISNHDYEKMAVKQIAFALATYIVDVLEKPLLEKNIKSFYSTLSEKEQNKLYIKSLEIIKQKNKVFKRDETIKTNIAEKLIDYFDKQWQINIEGFIRFRLQDYMDSLLEIIKEAQEELNIEKEYNDFIKLLRYFVDIQEPKINEAHLMKKGAKYLVLGDNYEVITEENYGDINGCDGIISCLVTYAPKKILIHIKDFYFDDEVLTTVNSIFDEKVVLCLGCNHCAESVDTSEEIKKT